MDDHFDLYDLQSFFHCALFDFEAFFCLSVLHKIVIAPFFQNWIAMDSVYLLKIAPSVTMSHRYEAKFDFAGCKL